MSKSNKPKTLEEKLDLTKITTDQNYAHIEINPEICKAKCTTYDCVYGCPADCYKFTEGEEAEGPVVFDYVACLECGTCRIVCPHGSVDWKYPKGGFGVEFKHS
jgi:ferredoxin like protein